MGIIGLNAIGLDGNMVIKKGGGNSGGGGGGSSSDIPVIGDGKTYLYIKIIEKYRMTVPLYFSQTVANGVTIDWGDGSATQTLSGTNGVSTTHTYEDTGEYTISLNPADGCVLRLGGALGLASVGLFGSINDRVRAIYRNMLQAVEIGKNVKTISSSTFYDCCSLSKIIIPEGVKSSEVESSAKYYSTKVFYGCSSLSDIVIPQSLILHDYMFYGCTKLSRIVIPKGITEIKSNTFHNCKALQSVEIPNSVTMIGYYAFGNCPLVSIKIPESVTAVDNYAFYGCGSIALYDFSQCVSIPILGGTDAFFSIPSDCKIVVPDALYDKWIVATNWSKYASNIVKASEFNS